MLYHMDAMYGRTDTELVRAYAGTQDERAFRELVMRHRQMVYRTCLRMLGDPHEAQDATQAAFVVLVKKAGNLRREGNLGGWLYDVSRKVALEALRRRETQARREKEVAVWNETTNGDHVSTADAETVLGILDQELAGLSQVLRQAVVLRYLQGHNEREAAVLAGCPLGTMKWRASEGIAQLRKRLTRRKVAMSAVALAGLLEAEAHAAVPETLFPSLLMAAHDVSATTAATAAVSPSATTLAEGVMSAMFWARIKTTAAAVAGVVAILVAIHAAVMVSIALEEPMRKTALAVPATNALAVIQQGKVKKGPAQVNVKVGGASVPLSVMKDGDDYFVVCPPCAGRISCQKLDSEKNSVKTVVKKGDTGFYACCPFCLNEINKNAATYAKLFDAGLTTAEGKDKAAAPKR